MSDAVIVINETSQAITVNPVLPGVPGPTGPTGATGATGATGPTGPTGPAGSSPQVFTFGVDEGWDFADGWAAMVNDDSTLQTNRAVVTDDTIVFDINVLAAVAGVDQTALITSGDVPLVIFPPEFFDAQDGYEVFYGTVGFDMFATTGVEYAAQGGLAYVDEISVDGPKGVYTTGDPAPTVWAVYSGSVELVNGFDLIQSFGTDGVVFDYIQVAVSFTLIRDLVIP